VVALAPWPYRFLCAFREAGRLIFHNLLLWLDIAILLKTLQVLLAGRMHENSGILISVELWHFITCQRP